MKTVIEMAREAGFPFNKFGLLQGDDNGEIDADQMLEAFAELARAEVEAKGGLLAEQPAPVHCEAGPEYCQQCHKEAFEDRSLALAAAVRYVKNNTPNLVWAEINRALATPQAQRKPLTPTLEADTGYSRAQRAAFEEGWKEAESAHGITKGNT